jgi:hypothetical protein
MCYYRDLSMDHIILKPVKDKLINIQTGGMPLVGEMDVLAEHLLAVPHCTAKYAASIGPGLNPDHSVYRPQDQKIVLPVVQPNCRQCFHGNYLGFQHPIYC